MSNKKTGYFDYDEQPIRELDEEIEERNDELERTFESNEEEKRYSHKI